MDKMEANKKNHIFSKEGSAMNAKYMIDPSGVKQYVCDNTIKGYEFGVKIPYYMGVPLSQIDLYKVYMDGTEVDPEDIRLIMKTGEEFKMSEILTVGTYFWEYGESLRTVVLKEGGLPKGEHELKVEVRIAVFYFPKDTLNTAILKFEIQEEVICQ